MQFGNPGLHLGQGDDRHPSVSPGDMGSIIDDLRNNHRSATGWFAAG
jgi:hypothetical protein